MARNILASLALAGIIERTGPGRSVLRVSPRFLAHAEGTAGRLQTLGAHADQTEVLRQALAGWDEFRHDTHHGAIFLRDILADKDQLGSLAPVFPRIESFQVAA